MENLTVEQVEGIHALILEDGGGDCRVLSEANLHQMVFHANLIPDCLPRAAFIFYSLCAYPAFREGNYQTALVVTERVLASEGYRITGDKGGIVTLAEGIREFTPEPEEIGQWLCDNTKKSIIR